eukprot:6488317-Amphidinium_carterae.1
MDDALNSSVCGQLQLQVSLRVSLLTSGNPLVESMWVQLTLVWVRGGVRGCLLLIKLKWEVFCSRWWKSVPLRVLHALSTWQWLVSVLLAHWQGTQVKDKGTALLIYFYSC